MFRFDKLASEVCLVILINYTLYIWNKLNKKCIEMYRKNV